MHTAAKVAIGIGIVGIIIGIILFTTTGDDFDEDVEEREMIHLKLLEFQQKIFHLDHLIPLLQNLVLTSN